MQSVIKEKSRAHQLPYSLDIRVKSQKENIAETETEEIKSNNVENFNIDWNEVRAKLKGQNFPSSKPESEDKKIKYLTINRRDNLSPLLYRIISKLIRFCVFLSAGCRLVVFQKRRTKLWKVGKKEIEITSEKNCVIHNLFNEADVFFTKEFWSDALCAVLKRNSLVNVVFSRVSVENLNKEAREKWEKNVH